MSQIIRIPEERLNILIGKEGQTKKSIEERCKVKLEISDGTVQINGAPAEVFFATDIVKAIGRGFAPRKAFKLLNSDFILNIIPLREITHSEKAMIRIKGRVIGEEGKIKKLIEESADSFISVYGSTISIISKVDTMEYAREAIGMIIDGAPHSTVLNYLAKARREIMDSRFRS
jgi:ribosomal RNA assembly protein